MGLPLAKTQRLSLSVRMLLDQHSECRFRRLILAACVFKTASAHSKDAPSPTELGDLRSLPVRESIDHPSFNGADAERPLSIPTQPRSDSQPNTRLDKGLIEDADGHGDVLHGFLDSFRCETHIRPDGGAQSVGVAGGGYGGARIA
jgi:hypothetical protein